MIGFACCVAFAMIALILFFYDRIPAVVRFLSGKTASVGVRHVWESEKNTSGSTGGIAFFRNRSGSKSLISADLKRGREAFDPDSTEKLKGGKTPAYGGYAPPPAIGVQAGSEPTALLYAEGEGVRAPEAGDSRASSENMSQQGEHWQEKMNETTILAEAFPVAGSGIRVIRSETVVHTEEG
jgi:hypothetical protein